LVQSVLVATAPEGDRGTANRTRGGSRHRQPHSRRIGALPTPSRLTVIWIPSQSKCNSRW